VVGTALALVNAPLMSLLVAASVISSASAAAVTTVLLGIVLPSMIPCFTLLAAMGHAFVTRNSLSDSFMSVALATIFTSRKIGATIGTALGEVVSVISDFFKPDEQQPDGPDAIQPQNLDNTVVVVIEPIGQPLSPAVIRENSSSHQAIYSILGANTDLLTESQQVELDAVRVQLTYNSNVVSVEPVPIQALPPVEPEQEQSPRLGCHVS